MPAPDYDAVCNHCGKEIHPMRPAGPGTPLPDDWVSVQRFGPTIMMHGLTNYVCLECNRLLTDFFSAAGVR